MRYVVDRDQMTAIMKTRKVRSPGGIAQKLGISRQRVMQLVDKQGKGRGFLAWCEPMGHRFGMLQYYVYVDQGPHDEVFDDPRYWYKEDPEQILVEAMKVHAADLANRASGE